MWLYVTSQCVPMDRLPDFRSAGVTGFLMVPQETELAAQARKSGIETCALVVDFDPGEEAKSKRNRVVDADGSEQTWFLESGCPNSPELRGYDLERASQIADLGLFDSLMLDGIRFPSPGAGLNPFLTCFCRHCSKKASEKGLDLNEIREWLREFRDRLSDVMRSPIVLPQAMGPLDGVQFCLEKKPFWEWLRFRSDCISEHVSELHRAVEGKLRLYAALFPPPLSALVGQDYLFLTRELDTVFPMTYTCYEGVACTNEEISVIPLQLAKGVETDQELLCKRIFGVLGFPTETAPRSLMAMKKYVSGRAIGLEVARAVSLAHGNAPIVPFLLLGDPKLDETVAECARQRPQDLAFSPL